MTRYVNRSNQNFPDSFPSDTPQVSNNNPHDVPVPPSQSSVSEAQPDDEPELPIEPESTMAPPENLTEKPEEIPIPDDNDDDLVCEGLYCHDVDHNVLEDLDENVGWRSEILVTEANIQDWRQSDHPEDLAFLVSAAKKQRAEVRLTELTASEKAEFVKAKDAEVSNWLQTGTVQRMFRNQIDPAQILRCRWILTWKPVEEGDKSQKPGAKAHKAKARLVVLGYLDPKLTEIPRDSPTLNRHSKMLLLQLIASMSWTLRSFDVRAAFLQGKPQQGRTIGLEPVPELAARMQLGPDEICRLAKSAYGLIDAPFLWFQALKEELLTLGFEQSPFCPCTFILRCPKTLRPEGIIGVHVDDGLCGGNERFLSKLAQLEKRYPFGSHKIGQFTFTGIEMFQHPNKSITLSQSEYVKKIEPIHIASARRTLESEPVTSEERLALRGLIGSLQYASVHTRPDLASSSVLDQLSWIRLCWAWLLDSRVKWQSPEDALQKLPLSFSTATVKAQNLSEDTIATDCKSLYDLITRTAPPACSEFRTQLNARKIKDMISEGVSVRWVHSGAQLADSLTKIMATSFLRETILQGKYRLNDELEILKARSDSRTRLKWLRNTCQEDPAGN
eukprot:s3530_g7.t1